MHGRERWQHCFCCLGRVFCGGGNDGVVGVVGSGDGGGGGSTCRPCGTVLGGSSVGSGAGSGGMDGR